MRILSFIFFMLHGMLLFAQTDSLGVVQDTVKQGAPVEVVPEYPGGPKALQNFLIERIKYPEEAREKGIAGRVVVKFIVDKEGNVTDVSVDKSVHPLLDQEAVRVVKLLEKFSPGTQNGKPVKVMMTLPVVFNLESGKHSSSLKDKNTKTRLFVSGLLIGFTVTAILLLQ